MSRLAAGLNLSSSFVTGGVSRVGKAFKLVDTVNDLNKAANVAKKVDKIMDASKVVKAADKVHDTSKVAKAVDKVTDVSKSVDKVDDVGDVVKASGRAQNKIKPDLNATGDHSVFKRDPITGTITNYKTYEQNPYNPTGFQLVKGYDGVGAEHVSSVTGIDIFTLHIHEKSTPGGIRIPEIWEIPGI